MDDSAARLAALDDWLGKLSLLAVVKHRARPAAEGAGAPPQQRWRPTETSELGRLATSALLHRPGPAVGERDGGVMPYAELFAAVDVALSYGQRPGDGMAGGPASGTVRPAVVFVEAATAALDALAVDSAAGGSAAPEARVLTARRALRVLAALPRTGYAWLFQQMLALPRVRDSGRSAAGGTEVAGDSGSPVAPRKTPPRVAHRAFSPLLVEAALG
jgi:hypothetical protein